MVKEGLGGGGMVVVVEESSHEQAAAMFSSSLSQTNGPPICLLAIACSDVTCKQASEVQYSDYELTTYIAGEDMRCIQCLVASSQCPKPRRESSTQTPPVQSLMMPPTPACPERLTCFSFSLTKPRDDNVTRDSQNQSNTTATTPIRHSIAINWH